MMNKITRTLLRIWLTLTSVAVFAVGWAAIAHSPKPAPLAIQSAELISAADIPDLEPIPSLESLTQGSARTTTSSQTGFNFSLPRLRTRGS